MRLRPAVALLLLSSGCFDLPLPSPPGVGAPGAVTGRVVWQRPGRLTPQAANGASVFLLGTNLAAMANDDGRFGLEGVTRSEGTLLIRFDADRDGVAERQRTFSLAELGADRGRTVSLGEVSLSQPGVVSGRVLRGDVGFDVDGGHEATPVFVPGLPFGALTLGSGDFVLEGLVEGPVQVAAVRAGYEAWLSAPVNLRGGEELRLARVVLTPSTAATSGLLRGRVVGVEGAPLAGVTVRAGALSLSTDSAGGWRFIGLLPDHYDVRFDANDRLPAALYNVLVAGPDEVVAPDVVMAEGAAAGTPSLVTAFALETDSRDAGPVTVGIQPSRPLTMLTVGDVVTLTAVTNPPNLQGANFEWMGDPHVDLSTTTGRTTMLTALSAGETRVDLKMTLNGVLYLANFQSGTISP